MALPRPRGHGFELYVPRTYAPSNRFLTVEEFIPGKNLTELKLEHGPLGHDRAVAELLACARENGITPP